MSYDGDTFCESVDPYGDNPETTLEEFLIDGRSSIEEVAQSLMVDGVRYTVKIKDPGAKFENVEVPDAVAERLTDAVVDPEWD